ncbi:hypothetical protein [Alicyclobacillus acidoterrestris]|uniref:Uncharacterized protein n=1 Tax=Alicyclobacillus acidoterrestris (strain ATCC 49025 / DSM 3922 / CIP 106132 / NCIMB 13137 / GD3B) TaxID=1356854 RepID=A0A9E6ZEK6_ALIAG|nr:hypothetical protein [Alicyclobacillus acidoterrestris]UNO48060.1 hypothetical protein K1I37_15410 [Alicyclobacillus acidoterrestris]
MTVLSGATASGRQFYQGQLSTSSVTTLYTAPAASSNVTSTTAGTSGSSGSAGSATAYVKEIVLSNNMSSSVTASITIGPNSSNQYPFIPNVTINGFDTKIISGLNTMLPANSVIQGFASAAGIYCTISGVEIQ